MTLATTKFPACYVTRHIQSPAHAQTGKFTLRDGSVEQAFQLVSAHDTYNCWHARKLESLRCHRQQSNAAGILREDSANDMHVIYSWNAASFVALEERDCEIAATNDRAAWSFSE